MFIYDYQGETYNSLYELRQSTGIALPSSDYDELFKELNITCKEVPDETSSSSFDLVGKVFREHEAKRFLTQTNYLVSPDVPKELVEAEGLNEEGKPLILDYRQYLFSILSAKEPLALNLLSLDLPTIEEDADPSRPVLSFEDWKSVVTSS